MCILFWLGMFKVCQTVSRVVAGRHYTSLATSVKADWDNFAWSTSHAIVAFLVRARVPCFAQQAS